MDELKTQAARGGLAKILSQTLTFSLRIIALTVLARLLEPRDFGLVGMAMAITGALSLFRDGGLSTATIQRASITVEQVSTLFWVNILVGAILGGVSVGLAPIAVSLYREPHIFWVVVALGTGFVFNALGVQHSAILQRRMRFTLLAAIDLLCLTLSIAIGVGMAVAGFGHWALVAMTVSSPAACAACLWLATGFRPRLPRWDVEISSMIRFGGLVTLNGFVAWVAYNVDKILVGRMWGAAALGIYGRAYQLGFFPTDSIVSAIDGVAFAALSRLQHDLARLKNYFLRAYSLVLALTLPVVVSFGLFADDIVAVVLGAKWAPAAPILRLLAPMILVFAAINPMQWLLVPLGLVARSTRIGLVMAALTISGLLIGLPYGPRGVALAYSTVMLLWMVPHLFWCTHGTVVSTRDLWHAARWPVLSAAVAAALGLLVQRLCHALPSLQCLLLEETTLFVAYVWLLLYACGQKAVYLKLLDGLNVVVGGRRPFERAGTSSTA